MNAFQCAALVAISLVLVGCDRRDATSAGPTPAAPSAPARTTAATATQAPTVATQPSPAAAPAGPAVKRQVRPPKVAANTDVANLVAALKLFAEDVGNFPTTEEGLDAISKPPPGVRGWHGPYMKGDASAVKDPWGNAYQYRSPGEHNPKGFDVFSTGPDGKVGGADDIGNW